MTAIASSSRPARARGRVSEGRGDPLVAKPLYLLPAFALLLIFFIGPAIATIAISFTDLQLFQAQVSFVGLDNYIALFDSRSFRTSLWNTVKLNLFVVPVSFFLALGLALAINSLTRLQGFWQTVYFLPVTTTLVAMALVWQWILHPEVGFVTQLLRLVALSPVNWLNDSQIVLYTLGFISIWQLVGYYTVLFLAGLKSIPRPVYEAAAVDGARGALDRFLHVTWPLLAPTSLFVFVITVIKSFQIFDVVKVLTDGGPFRSSEIILYTLYQEGFVYFRMGTASAIATLFFAVMLLLTLYQMRVFERHVHYR